jgi:predicted transcriptional regulator of viral defense system
MTPLRDLLGEQQGYFSIDQAHAAGISSQLVRYHCQQGKFERVRRGIYRATEYPIGERDDLVVLWLWSRRLGVFSHATALSLHELGELMSDRVHMTLPPSEKHWQRQIPAGLVLHYGEVGDDDRAWYESVPVTTVRRTLLDGVASSMNPSMLRGALEQAVDRGLLDVDSITAIARGIEQLEATR